VYHEPRYHASTVSALPRESSRLVALNPYLPPASTGTASYTGAVAPSELRPRGLEHDSPPDIAEIQDARFRDLNLQEAKKLEAFRDDQDEDEEDANVRELQRHASQFWAEAHRAVGAKKEIIVPSQSAEYRKQLVEVRKRAFNVDLNRQLQASETQYQAKLAQVLNEAKALEASGQQPDLPALAVKVNLVHPLESSARRAKDMIEAQVQELMGVKDLINPLSTFRTHFEAIQPKVAQAIQEENPGVLNALAESLEALHEKYEKPGHVASADFLSRSRAIIGLRALAGHIESYDKRRKMLPATASMDSELASQYENSKGPLQRWWKRAKSLTQSSLAVGGAALGLTATLLANGHHAWGAYQSAQNLLSAVAGAPSLGESLLAAVPTAIAAVPVVGGIASSIARSQVEPAIQQSRVQRTLDWAMGRGSSDPLAAAASSSAAKAFDVVRDNIRPPASALGIGPFGELSYRE